MPDWIIKNRYGSNYWQLIKGISASYQGRRDFIDSEFQILINFVENGGYEPVSASFDSSVKVFDTENINSSWKKIHLRKNSDPEGAITASKTLLESTIKHILDKLSVNYKEVDELPQLYRDVLKALDLKKSSGMDQVAKQIFSGTVSVVLGVSALRNKLGDAHGKGMERPILDQNYVELTINLACSMSVFLIQSYLSLSKKIDKGFEYS